MMTPLWFIHFHVRERFPKKRIWKFSVVNSMISYMRSALSVLFCFFFGRGERTDRKLTKIYILNISEYVLFVCLTGRMNELRF